MPKYNKNAIYEVKFENGTGPCTARWNEERKGWIINHPLAGPNCFFPEHAVTVTNVIYQG